MEGERAIHTLSAGLENRGGQLRWRAAAFSWVPQLEDVQALLRQSGEGEDHVPQYCHCLCHSSAPGSSGARRGVSTVVYSQSKGPQPKLTSVTSR